MTDIEEVEQTSPTDYDNVEPAEKEAEPEPEPVAKSYSKRSDKTKAELTKESKQRAIDNFKHGIPDPEYRVVKLNSGKFRCYPRKEPLSADPINVNQIAENRNAEAYQLRKRSSELIDNSELASKPRELKAPKQHDPFSDIVYYNMTNQISEQLNKRLDAVNLELERLRHKNSKLKGKYKQLKQAIYITEEEDSHEEKEIEPQQQQQQPIQQQQQATPASLQVQPGETATGNASIAASSVRPIRRTTGINFNRFFN